MKKLALLLAAMTAVSAVASAKEVVAAPVVAVEPAALVCPEPVVVTPAWRPTGFVDLQYKYYGSDEYDSSEFGRMQLMGSIKTTPDQHLEFRVRQFNTYESTSGISAADRIAGAGEFTQTRLRYFNNTGNIGDSKVNLTHRLQYIGSNGTGSAIAGATAGGSTDPINAFGINRSQSAQYMARFQFKDYFDFMPTWFTPTSVMLAPQYTYAWTDNNGAYTNTLGLDVYTFWRMPANFRLEFNMYPAWRENNVTTRDDEYMMAIEAYLYYGYNLYKDGNFAVDFNAEGGFDPYRFNSKKTGSATDGPSLGDLFGDREKDTYSVYLMPSIDVSYQANNSTKLYAGVAGEYRNWRNTKQTSAQNWDWMPQVYAGFRTSF